VDEERMRVSAMCCLQCFGTDGLLTERQRFSSSTSTGGKGPNGEPADPASGKTAVKRKW